MEKALINEAIEQLLHQEMYLPLTRDDFEAICPEPELAIHILAGSADQLRRGLSSCSPENNEIELWLFASALKLL